jgi:hypothetical protein
MVDKGLFVEAGTGPTDPTRRYRLANPPTDPAEL